MLRFPIIVKPNGQIRWWLFGHVAFTWVLFGILYYFTGNFYIACLAGFFYPIRALVWKAPWGYGHDDGDPLNDYAWGAIVPFMTVLIAFILFASNS
jgi:hypothetical protein